jgi:1-phosphofructokinase
MIATLTMNPALDLTLVFRQMHLGRLNRAHALHRHASGKGINVAVVLHRLNLVTRAYCLLGGETGVYIEKELRRWGIPLVVIPIQGETRTNVKVIELEAESRMTELNTSGPPISLSSQAEIKEKILLDLVPDDLAVLSGSLPAGVPANFYADLAGALAAKGIKTVVDTSGAALNEVLRQKPYLVKPNRQEAEELLGVSINTIKEAAQAAAAIKDLGAQNVVLSLGADGALLLAGENEGEREHGAWWASSPPVSVQGTAGCGDALLAGVVAGRERGYSWQECLCLGVAAATAAARLPGTTLPEYEQIAAELQRIKPCPIT